MSKVFNGAEKALESCNGLQDDALDELTSLVIFLEECDDTNIKYSDIVFGKYWLSQNTRGRIERGFLPVWRTVHVLNAHTDGKRS